MFNILSEAIHKFKQSNNMRRVQFAQVNKVLHLTYVDYDKVNTTIKGVLNKIDHLRTSNVLQHQVKDDWQGIIIVGRVDSGEPLLYSYKELDILVKYFKDKGFKVKRIMEPHPDYKYERYPYIIIKIKY